MYQNVETLSFFNMQANNRDYRVNNLLNPSKTLTIFMFNLMVHNN